MRLGVSDEVVAVLGGDALVVRVRRRRRRRVGSARALSRERIPEESSNSRSPSGPEAELLSESLLSELLPELLLSLRLREAESEEVGTLGLGLISRARSLSTSVGGGGGPAPADSAGRTSTSTRGGPSLMLFWRVTLVLIEAVVALLSLSLKLEPNNLLLRI